MKITQESMGKMFVAGLCLTVLCGVAKAADDGTSFKTTWKDGVRVESEDGQHKVKMGGRLMYDFIWNLDNGNLGDVDDGSEVRRARFYTSGTLYENVLFKLQFDWSGKDTSLKAAYLGLKGLPGGADVKVGHMYEPYSLSAMVSSKYNTFMERPPVVNAFSPVRNAGIMLSDTMADDRFSLAAGIFRDVDSQGKSTSEEAYAGTARLTALPLWSDDGQTYIHVGMGGSYRHTDGSARFSARPSIHLAPRLLDTRSEEEDPETEETITTDIAADEYTIYALEAAAVMGPFSIQSEWLGAEVDVNEGGDYSPAGGYIQASYFLTGEHRPYSQKGGRFGKVKPTSNFGKEGLGAWEVSVRLGTADLNEGEIRGGSLDETTVGLNVYLNPSARVMFNYVMADSEEEGDVSWLGTRMQIAF